MLNRELSTGVAKQQCTIFVSDKIRGHLNWMQVKHNLSSFKNILVLILFYDAMFRTGSKRLQRHTAITMLR